MTSAKGSLSEEVLKDESGVNTVLTGAYGGLNYFGFSHGQASPRYWLYGSIVEAIVMEEVRGWSGNTNTYW
ncbi:MAG: hypothetical protein U5K72_18405 [Balneolaceae bacterium]|nr:hypothetical protein [Balneolaceae bacterium]